MGVAPAISAYRVYVLHSGVVRLSRVAGKEHRTRPQLPIQLDAWLAAGSESHRRMYGAVLMQHAARWWWSEGWIGAGPCLDGWGGAVKGCRGGLEQ